MEKSKALLPWTASFNTLKNYGNPEIRTHVGRQMVVWKNEEILDGVVVDLNVVYEPRYFSQRQKLKNVSAYISGSEFEKARTHFSSLLGRKGKFHKLNEVEYTYTWKVGRCKLVLSHLDRFGSFWRIDIQRNWRFDDMLKPIDGVLTSLNRAKTKAKNKIRDLFQGFFIEVCNPVETGAYKKMETC